MIKPPTIITKKYDFILSKKKVLKLILLKPNFSSIIKFRYNWKGIEIISLIKKIEPKNKRDKLISYAKEKGVELKCHYPLPVHKLPAYKTDKYSLPITDLVSSQQVSLPIYPGVDYKRVIEVIKQYD